MLSQSCISEDYQHEHDLIVVFNLRAQIKQTGSHRELTDPPEEEDLKSKLQLSTRVNAMAMLPIVEQCILQLEAVKLEDLKPGSSHIKDRHLLLTVMRILHLEENKEELVWGVHYHPVPGLEGEEHASKKLPFLTLVPREDGRALKFPEHEIEVVFT